MVITDGGVHSDKGNADCNECKLDWVVSRAIAIAVYVDVGDGLVV